MGGVFFYLSAVCSYSLSRVFPVNWDEKARNQFRVVLKITTAKFILCWENCVLSSFGFFSVQSASSLSHNARIILSFTYTLSSKIMPKSDKANL